MRIVQRPLIWRAILAIALFLLSLSPALAATITVDATCSLADAITSANTDSSTGGCAAGNGVDTIVLSANVPLSALLPNITSKMTIQSQGGSFTISGEKSHRIFSVDSSGNLTIKNLTLTNGAANDGGAAIKSLGGTLTIENSSIQNSVETSAGGGGIHVLGGTLSIINSTLAGNQTSGYGGAILLEGSNLTMTLTNVTIYDNRSTSSGGGISINGGTTTITNSTIANNTSSGSGGGIYQASGNLTLIHVTLVNNQTDEAFGSGGLLALSGVTKIHNSILANNGGSGDCEGILSENSGNLIEIYTHDFILDPCSLPAVSSDPELGQLTGSPAYYPLYIGSPAIDAANAAYCANTDQRGVSRISTACDIGAYEGSIPKPSKETGSRTLSPTTARTQPQKTCPLLLPAIAVTDLTGATQCQRIDAEGVGIQSVIDRGIVDAVDVWSYVGAGTQVCFQASGSSFSFLDAATAPRTVRSLPLHIIDGKTCTFIDGHGSVVLHPGVPIAQPVEAAGSPHSGGSCQAVTTDALNLRASANGEIMTGLAAGITLDVVAHADGWVEVDFYGRSGWVSADYVRLTGEC